MHSEYNRSVYKICPQLVCIGGFLMIKCCDQAPNVITASIILGGKINPISMSSFRYSCVFFLLVYVHNYVTAYIYTVSLAEWLRRLSTFILDKIAPEFSLTNPKLEINSV